MQRRTRGAWFAVLVIAVLPLGQSATAAPSATHASSVVRESISFKVTNPTVPGSSYTIRGEIVRPQADCSSSVLLAMHGLSYGAWAWDYPIQPEKYSVAQALAKRGFATVTVDELGYGQSAGAGKADQPDGYTLTVFAYEDITAQIAEQLRSGTYTSQHPVAFSHLGLMGHSAGSEIVELTAALHPGLADVLIPTAYTHEPWPNNHWLVREWSTDNERSLLGDYEYFETNVATRSADMYHLANADPKVVAWDNKHANLTPAGEILSLSPQLSRPLIADVTVPVLLVLAQYDTLFPASGGAGEMLYFAAATDKTLITAPNAGHAFMLQRNAPETNAKIANWLDEHPANLPHC